MQQTQGTLPSDATKLKVSDLRHVSSLMGCIATSAQMQQSQGTLPSYAKKLKVSAIRLA